MRISFKHHTDKSFQRALKGYEILFKSGRLGLWRKIKEEFLQIHPSCIRKYNSFVFAESEKYADLAVHQYCAHIFPMTWLDRSVLENVAQPQRKIVYPLPSRWIEVLVNQSYSIARFRSGILFILAVLAVHLLKLGYITGLLLKPSCQEKDNSASKKNVHFLGLINRNNLPGLKGARTYDLLSWYLQSEARIAELGEICHNLSGVTEMNVEGITIRYRESPIERMRGARQKISLAWWALLAVPLSWFELLRGRWWHALMIGELAAAKVVALNGRQSLADVYYFHYSGGTYRPLWTFQAELLGSEIISYFYSISEQPKLPFGDSSMKFEYLLYNWPVTLVWDDLQAQTIAENSQFNMEYRIVGPIWFSDTEEILDNIVLNSIAVFDNEEPQKKFHFGFSTYSEWVEAHPNPSVNLLKDIADVSQKLDIKAVHKPKRSIGVRRLPVYASLLEQLKNNICYQVVSSDISAIKVIDACDVVISQPFTSTALYGAMRNKPSVFYDPTGWIQKDDPAAHGIPVLTGRTELEEWLKSVFENKTAKKIRNDIPLRTE
jgi:polysaccharide biosynthesis PFTS motif protein